ncbi:MAG: PaaI family thioesterase [Chloroflexota bacterium]
MTIDLAALDTAAEVINDSLSDHHCFGCGDLNPSGLQLRFRLLPNDDGVWARFSPDRGHEGYLGMVHGGILSTMLDEAMSWAITTSGALGVTARMEVAFRQPASVGDELIVVGQVQDRRRRLIDVRGSIYRVSDHGLIADAEARFMKVSSEQAAAWRSAYRADASSAFGRAADQGSC